MPLRSSRTVQALLAPTLFCFAQTVAVGAYATLHTAAWPELPAVGQEFFNLTSNSLGLLLVFRTDASYTRWDEARRQWGEVRRLLALRARAPCMPCTPAPRAAPEHARPPACQVIFNGRNLLRRTLEAYPSEEEGLKCQMIKWTVAFGVLLKLHLREDTKRSSLERELGAWLSPADVALLASARHKPNAALQVLGRLVRAAPAAERSSLEGPLTAFSEALGRCERISRVPIPLSYTRHTSRFLIAWLILLPFGLWSAMGWDAVLFAPLTAFLLFGIDQIGVDLEYPFAVLPMDVLANKLKLDAADMIALSLDVGQLVEAGGTAAALAPARTDAALLSSAVPPPPGGW